MSLTLFDDIFVITEIDNANYDKVSRVTARSKSSQEIQLTIDINHDLFPIEMNETLTVALTASLTESSETGESVSWRPPRAGEHSLADDYDYVMYGTVYKFNEGKDDKISVFVSFGGLLMCLEGPYRSLSSLKQEHVYILIRR
ncbi:DNA-directed RNA polymerase core subunit [Saccharomycopsis crataegensis]|uniref:DNA-directed RNA polymerases I, II, and III subunit RPABC3 n=1 Tax=Saccharomycopsis crataegensis TaxID=43959 RepID=A0AAV5QRQ5_9ASCO|nr:DNA-directed RNA polymerase core subunit [Saccharomycopsis crataegensis]